MIEIPPEFFAVPYDGTRHPHSATFEFGRGANCQLWAFAVLAHFGLHVPAVRSSELWADTAFGRVVTDLEPLDLLLFNDTDSAWGAHVGVYLGGGLVAHLSRAVGVPEVRRADELTRDPKYRVLVGAKRVSAVCASTPCA